MDNFERRIKRILNSKKIRNKSDYLFMWHEKLLGNKALTWNSFQEAIDSGWKKPICFRGKKNIKRSLVHYNISLNKVKEKIQFLETQGIKESDLTFNQSMPDEDLTIQGELTLSHRGLELHYTTKKVPMNQALKKEQINTHGLQAILLLKRYTDPASYEDLNLLLDIFPDAVIEFSCYRIPIGHIKGRNTVIWEVRNY
jgi:hypothetical protein